MPRHRGGKQTHALLCVAYPCGANRGSSIATRTHLNTATADTSRPYVTHLIEAGYDPMFVQQQVGHSYSSTTALYTSVSSDFKQKTIQRMIARRIARPQEESDV